MKLQFTLAVFIFILACPIHGFAMQETENPDAQEVEHVYIPFEWKQGDKRKYRITNSTSQQNGNATKPGKVTIREIELEVVEKSDKGLIVTWMLGDSGKVNAAAASDPMTAEITKIYSKLKIRVQIDGDGVYQGVQNWEEIDAANEKLKVILRQIVNGLDMPLGQRQGVWNTVMKQYGTRQAIEAKMTEPLQLLVAMANLEFQKKGVEKYQSQVPYLGKTLPATEQYSVTKFDIKKQLVNVAWAREIDKEKSQPMIEQAMTELAKDLKKEIPNPGSLKGYSLSSTGNYEIDLKTGWPVKIVLEHKAGLEGSLSIRLFEIESR